jgi:hypothetical protein
MVELLYGLKNATTPLKLSVKLNKNYECTIKMGIIFCLPRAAAVEVRTYIFEIRQMKCDIAFLTVVDRVSSFSDMGGVYDQSEKEPEFDWLQLHNEIHNQELEETTQQKFIRKVKDNPFVPIGIYTVAT